MKATNVIAKVFSYILVVCSSLSGAAALYFWLLAVCSEYRAEKDMYILYLLGCMLVGLVTFCYACVLNKDK